MNKKIVGFIIAIVLIYVERCQSKNVDIKLVS